MKSLLSIYVQLFVKAGGVPYLVSNSYILSNTNEYNIIIGYSLSRDPIRHNNAVGSIIVYNPAGQWLVSEFVLAELPFNDRPEDSGLEATSYQQLVMYQVIQ